MACAPPLFTGRAIRHRACALRDTASAIMTAELDSDFEKLCEEIKETRQRRSEFDCLRNTFMVLKFGG